MIIPSLFDLDVMIADTHHDERNREFFRTPNGISDYLVTCLLPDRPIRPVILDAGAGDGSLGQAARRRWPNAIIVGVDLPGVKRPPGYSIWREADFLALATRWISLFPRLRFDAVICNPPFTRLEDFARLGHQLLKPGGVQVFFLRIAVMAGLERMRHLWKTLPPQHMAVSSRRPVFVGNHSDPKTEYMLPVWIKGRTDSPFFWFDFDDPKTWQHLF